MILIEYQLEFAAYLPKEREFSFSFIDQTCCISNIIAPELADFLNGTNQALSSSRYVATL